MGSLPSLIEEDIDSLDAALNQLLTKSEASAALIVDKGGFLITQSGSLEHVDTTSLGALGAGSFAATQQLADLIGERNFNSIYQQGENSSLLAYNVDDHCLIIIIFPANTSVGAVKYYATLTIPQIAAQLKVAKERAPGQTIDLSELNLADTTALFRKKGT